MKKVRFVQRSGVETRAYGKPSHPSEAVDERESLPEETGARTTYRNARINKHLAVHLVAGAELDEPSEGD